jgi:hypothetical protein
MTVKSGVERFYQVVASAKNTTPKNLRAMVDRGYVVELLNVGMRAVAEKTGGIRGLYKHTLTTDKEIYELSSMGNDVISIDAVTIYKSGDVQCVLIPEAPEALEFLDTTVTSATPEHCSVKIQKHDSNAAIYELRLYPPANWTEASALVITARVRPTAITDDATAFDCPDALGDAGFWQACYDYTLDPRFEANMHKALQRFYASGISQSVKYPMPPGVASGGGDPRSTTATMT